MKKCTLCSGSGFAKIINLGDYKIVKCEKCGLVKTVGQKSTNYAQYHRDEEYDKEEKLFKNIFLRRYKRIAKHRSTPGKVLDIGSSTGTLLSVFKDKGWEVWGVEPSKKAAGIARAKHIKTTVGMFEKIKLPSNYFDVAVVNHVLEHVGNPVGFLAKVHKVLKTGGLVYVDVPNFGSRVSVLQKSKWHYLMPWEHLHHFTPDTLDRVIEKAGFVLISRGTSEGVFDLGNPILELWQSLLRLKKRFFYQIVTIPSALLDTVTNKGEGMYAIGKKQ